MPKKNLRQLQLIREFLESKGQVFKETKKEISKEELASDTCYWDYSEPTFIGDVRLSCQHRSRSGELQHREFILVVPNTGIIQQLGREGKLRGVALEEYYEKNN